MAKSTIRRSTFVAAAFLAVAMVLSACGAFDAHAANPGAAEGCCASVYDGTSASRADAAPAGKGGEVPLLPGAFMQSTVRAPLPAASSFTAKVLPQNSFYARSARILR